MANNNTEGSNVKVWQAILIGIVIGVLSGIGASQMTMAADVREAVSLAKQNAVIHDRDMIVINTRIEKILQVFESHLEANRALVQTLDKWLTVWNSEGPPKKP